MRPSPSIERTGSSCVRSRRSCSDAWATEITVALLEVSRCASIGGFADKMKTSHAKDNSGIRALTIRGYIARARERAKRRKSPWNLILIPLVIFGIMIFFAGQFILLWQVHVWAFPEHAGKFRDFWGKNISVSAFVSSFLMGIFPLFASLPLGMLLANCIAWCLPPARRAFEQEAKDIPRASFYEAMRDLG